MPGNYTRAPARPTYQKGPEGRLWAARERKSDKSPHVTGYLEISRELLNDLITKAKANEPIKMNVIGYINPGLEGKADWTKLVGLPHEERRVEGGATRAPSVNGPRKGDPVSELDDDIPFDARG